jgi:hypothetical protein
MNINPHTTVEIDELLAGNFRADDLQNHTDQLGFYRKSASVYVLSTRNIANRQGFNSQIVDLARILNASQFDPVQMNKLSVDQSYMVIRYLNCVYKVIDKHNHKAEEARSNLFVWLLSLIPLVGRVVNIFYYTIQNPTNFVERLHEQQKQKVQGFFTQAGTLRSLKNNKEQVERALSLADRETASLIGNGLDVSEWAWGRRMINEVFEKALEQKTPPLAKARAILNPDEIIHLVEPNASFESLQTKAHQLIQELQVPDDVMTVCTEGQKERRLQAIAKIKLAEARWIATHLSHIYEEAGTIHETPKITALLGIDDIVEMGRRFVCFHQALFQNNMGQDIRTRLERSFSNYIQPLMDDLIVDASRAQSLKTPKDVKELFHRLIHILETYKLFHTTLGISPERASEIERREQDLKMIRDRNLCRLVPLYGAAREILNLGNYQSSVPLISQSHSANYSEEWYEAKLRYFEYEIQHLDANDFSADTYAIILNAHKYLQNQYTCCKKERMEKVVREQHRTKSLYAHLGNFLFGKDTGQEQPAKMYKESLLKLLNMKDGEDFAKFYASKLEELEKLPDSGALKEIIQTAFRAYNRAMQIQPFLTKVSKGLLFKGDLTVEDLNPKKKAIGAFRDDVHVLVKLLEEEINVQKLNGNQGLVANLEKTRDQIKMILNQEISVEYPQYKRLLELQKKYSEMGFSPKLTCTQAQSEFKDVIENIEASGKGEETPAFLNDAFVLTKLVVTHAYKKWESERILRVYAHWQKVVDDKKMRDLDLYGLSNSATDRDVKMRKRALILLLHPDKTPIYRRI